MQTNVVTVNKSNCLSVLKFGSWRLRLLAVAGFELMNDYNVNLEQILVQIKR